MVAHKYIYTPVYRASTYLYCRGWGGIKNTVIVVVWYIYIPLCTQGINMSILGVAAVRKTTIGLL